ncbi:MAG: VOC family protein [Bacteroidales bacterium]
MPLSNLSTALFVKNIKVSRAFYTKILDQEISLDFGKNIIFKSGFSIWEISRSHIITQTLGYDKITDKSSVRNEIYFETENIEMVYEKLKSEPIEFLHHLHEEDWGQRTVRFFDPDRHLIEIGESLKEFVMRFYKHGFTPNQISEKTHVPVEHVELIVRNSGN